MDEMKRELRKTKKALKNLSGTVGEFLRLLDETMAAEKDKAVGTRVARLANALDMANDQVRYFSLGVDYRKDKSGGRGKG